MSSATLTSLFVFSTSIGRIIWHIHDRLDLPGRQRLRSVILPLPSNRMRYCLLPMVSTTLPIFVHRCGYGLFWLFTWTDSPTWSCWSGRLCMLYCSLFSICLFAIVLCLNCLVSGQRSWTRCFSRSIVRWSLIVRPHNISDGDNLRSWLGVFLCVIIACAARLWRRWLYPSMQSLSFRFTARNKRYRKRSASSFFIKIFVLK